jgi:hypothetical protein
MSNSNSSKVVTNAADQQLADGLTKHESAIGSFLIGGKAMTVANVIAIVISPIAPSKDVVVKRAALEASIEAERAARAQSRTVVSAVKQALQVMFAGQVDVLADFGLKGRKPRVVPPKTQVAAAARAAATRKLRGTQGPKAKLATQAPPVEVSTASAPVTSHAPEPTPAPAPAPTPAPAPGPAVAPAPAPAQKA